MFKIHTSVGQARAGVVEFDSASIVTPTCFIRTRKGFPEHLTVDVMKQISLLTSLHIAMNDLLEVDKVMSNSAATTNTVASFLKLPASYVFYLSMQYEEALEDCSISNERVAISAERGRLTITAAEYMNSVRRLCPQMATICAPEAPMFPSAKASAKISQATLHWADQCINALPNDSTIKLMAAVPPLSNQTERLKLAKELAGRSKLFGFVLAPGTDPNGYDDFLRSTISVLPTEKIRLLNTSGSPLEVLNAVECGVDLFCSNYPSLMTEWGFVLSFPLSVQKSAVGADKWKINVRDRSLAISSAPLVDGCDCIVCKRHTRSYLHHLFNTHELLGNVLLTVHNVHYYLKFFQVIRRCLADKSLQEYKKAFQ